MKFLITGFVPFSNNEINPSELVLKELSNKYSTLLLPVSYDKAPALLKKAILKEKPDIIISLGLAANRPKISLEIIGINYKGASIPDNDGILIKGEKIDDTLSDGIITELDINSLVDTLKNNNIDSYVSTTAGTYICNLVYFTALNYTKKSLFIHLPNLDNSSLEDDIKALNLIIDKINDGS